MTQTITLDPTSISATAIPSRLLRNLNNVSFGEVAICSELNRAAMSVGNLVEVRPDFYNLPVVFDKNNEPIPVYHIIEVLEEAVDLDYAMRELPTLGPDKIIGVIHFVRRLSMFNTNEVDLDQCQIMREAADNDLIDSLRKAVQERDDIVDVYTKPD